jgi:hypothetical protein
MSGSLKQAAVNKLVRRKLSPPEKLISRLLGLGGFVPGDRSPSGLGPVPQCSSKPWVTRCEYGTVPLLPNPATGVFLGHSVRSGNVEKKRRTSPKGDGRYTRGTEASPYDKLLLTEISFALEPRPSPTSATASKSR